VGSLRMPARTGDSTAPTFATRFHIPNARAIIFGGARSALGGMCVVCMSAKGTPMRKSSVPRTITSLPSIGQAKSRQRTSRVTMPQKAE